MENILGTQGLTSTEANHVTNVVKELVKRMDVTKLSLQTSSVENENGGLPRRLDENEKNEDWVSNIKRVGELFSLSAWLKTGVKHKEDLLTKQGMRTIKLVQPALAEYPENPDTSLETYFLSLGVKEYNEYLSAESVASHIGKFIHNFDSTLQASENFKPTDFAQMNGVVRTIVNTRLYTRAELKHGFFDLQKEHREAEKTVNLYKARHKEWQKNLLDDHSREVQAISESNMVLTREAMNANQKASLDLENEKRDKKKEISTLKIVIPHALQETLDYVNTFAKK